MPRWGMAADLDRCTGCGACVTACHAENNISTVGPYQAMRGRAKHWIRVERYWEGEFPDVKLKFRPVMCQQCGNAPYEVGKPMGHGHTQFTRYATGRGENPATLLAPLTEPSTGAMAWAATRVSLARAGGPDGRLVLFAGGKFEEGHEHEEHR